MKYIIVIDNGIEQAVLFSEAMEHKTAAAGFAKVVAAGKFGTVTKDFCISVNAFGKSVGLKLESRPEDAEIIQRSLTFQGV